MELYFMGTDSVVMGQSRNRLYMGVDGVGIYVLAGIFGILV